MKQIYASVLFFFSLAICSFGQKSVPADQLIQKHFAEAKDDQKSNSSYEYEILSDHLDKKSGLRKINAVQKINGIYHRDGVLTLAYGHYGKSSTMDRFSYASATQRSASIPAEDAVTKAFEHLKLKNYSTLKLKETFDQPDQRKVFHRNAATADDILVRLMYIEFRGQTVLTWETQIHTADRQNYWITYVHASSGQILDSEDKVLHCSFGEGVSYDASPEEQKWIDEKHHQMHMEAALRWDETMAEKKSDKGANLKGHHNHDHAAQSETMNSDQNQQMAVAPMNKYLVLDMPAEAPNDNSTTNTQTIVETDGHPTASPFGWTSNDDITQFMYSRGNNVWAFYDPSPGPLGGAPNPGTGAQATSSDAISGVQEFIYPWDLTKEPEYETADPLNTFPNRNAAIVNLFYWNNIIHDLFFGYGFDEAGRNFQFDNMGNGGLGNDEILAQAQDGGGTNNANFLTLADGVNGQMQMYLWTSSVKDTLARITSVSIPTSIEGGDGFEAIQGALYNTAMPPATVDLVNNPVLDRQFLLINDGCGSSEGCGAGGGVGLAPCNTVTNAIVLIDRGSCSFAEKVDGAQKGGAAGVIVMNNDAVNPDAVLAMGGTDPTVNTITIPAIMVSYNSGLLLKQALADGANVIGSLKMDGAPEPKKDGDFDNGIIAHEYGHGISTRISPQTASGGSLSGSEQGGEGWADYIALFMTTRNDDLSAPSVDFPNGQLPDRGIGTYVIFETDQGGGIRPRRYSVDMNTNEYTYTGETNGGFGVTGGEITIPHGIGFIWCTMLWEMTQNLVNEYGMNDDVYYVPPSTGNLLADIADIQSNSAGNNLAMKLILDGISLQASSPTFSDMRDGILMADTLLYNGHHSCMIWEAFAKRGLGVNATSGTNAVGDEKDGYGNPCILDQVFYDIAKSGPSILNNNTIISYDIIVENTSPFDNAGTNVEVLDVLPEHLIFLDAFGASFVVVEDTVKFTIASLGQGEIDTLTIEAFVNVDETAQVDTFYNFEAGTEGWLAVTGGNNSFGRVDNDAPNAHDGDAFFYTPNEGLGGANTTLTSPVLDTTVKDRQLRFWHKFNTDAGYDGGFLEATIDGGVTWVRMPLQENGYNGALNSTFNPANAGAAFTGVVPGYIESAGALADNVTQIRFVFSEDSGFGGGEGWWIDDIKIVEGNSKITNFAHVDDPINSGGRRHTDAASTLVILELPDNACEYVTLTQDEGVGSLHFAIGCARDGDTIRFAPVLHTDTIKLVSNEVIVDKDLSIIGEPIGNIFIEGVSVTKTFGVTSGSTVNLVGLNIISGSGLESAALLNEGELVLKDVQIYTHPDGNQTAILITNKGILKMEGSTQIHKD